jgi:GntR family transcriptional regulator
LANAIEKVRAAGDELDPAKQLAAGAAELASRPAELPGVAVTRVSRLRLVDGVPRMLVNTFAPARLLGDADPRDFPETGPGQSILRILGERFKLEWSAACEDISPVIADAEMAAIFAIAPGSPLLRQACSAFAEDGSTVFHEDVYRTGNVTFTLSRQGRTPRHL